MYPKADGSFFVYDPTMKMTDPEFQAISEEIQFKVVMLFLLDIFKSFFFQLEAAEKTFPGRSAYHYPNLEGNNLRKFVQIFVQNGDWETACRYHKLLFRGQLENFEYDIFLVTRVCLQDCLYKRKVNSMD